SEISFDLTGKVCLKVPFLGWKCVSYSHTFVIPLPGTEKVGTLAESLSDEAFATALLLAAHEDHGCSCS
ncbi:MAG: hypothetical protein AAFQ98_20435, partial [Bacteroidota bacterium]